MNKHKEKVYFTDGLPPMRFSNCPELREEQLQQQLLALCCSHQLLKKRKRRLNL